MLLRGHYMSGSLLDAEGIVNNKWKQQNSMLSWNLQFEERERK